MTSYLKGNVLSSAAVYLRNEISDALISTLREFDYVFTVRGAFEDLRRHRVNAVLIPQADEDIENRLLFNLVSNAEILKNEEYFEEMVLPFLNEYYTHSLRSQEIFVSFVKDQIKNKSIGSVAIYSYQTTSKKVPFSGFATQESTRGSKKLYNSVIAQRLQEELSKLPDLELKTFKKFGDILCIQFLRRFILRFFNRVLELAFLIKLLLLKLANNKKVDKKKCSLLILARAKHHFRFALKMSERIPESKVLVVPQVTSLLGRDALRFYIHVRELGKQVSFQSIDFLKVIVEYKRSKKQLQMLCQNPVVKSNPEMAELIKEISCVSAVFLYRAVLSAVVSRIQPTKLLSFEISGRMASFEASVAKEKSIESVCYQTVLLSRRPIPFFPVSDYFLADSLMSSEIANSVGFRKLGISAFSGVLDFEPYLSKVHTLRRIAYFSQPYENEVSIEIIQCLANWSKNNCVELTVKLHPRDRATFYHEKLDSDTLIVQDSDTVEIIRRSDVVITRTSSVAKEAIILGKPILLCLWSDIDKGADADYFGKGLNLRPTCTNEKELTDLLNDLTVLNSSNETLRAAIYGNYRGDQLSRFLE